MNDIWQIKYKTGIKSASVSTFNFLSNPFRYGLNNEKTRHKINLKDFRSNNEKDYFNNKIDFISLPPVKMKESKLYMSCTNVSHFDKIMVSKDKIERKIIQKEKQKLENFLLEKINLNSKQNSSSIRNNHLFSNTVHENLPNFERSIEKRKNFSHEFKKHYKEDVEKFIQSSQRKIKNKNNSKEIKSNFSEILKQNENNLNHENSIHLKSLTKIKSNTKRIIKKYMNRVSDSLEDENEEDLAKIEENGRFLIFPNSIFKQVWDINMIIIFTYTLFISPLSLAFYDIYHNAILLKVENIIDIFYTIDIFINFLIPYHDVDDVFVLNNYHISKRYFESYFLLDFIAAIPFNSYFLITGFYWNKSKNDIYKLLILMRIIKFLSIFNNSNKDKEELDWFISYNISSRVKRFLKFITLFLIITHVISCIWIYLATLDNPNWISSAYFMDLGKMELYIASIYFNWTTIFTIGYGDILSISIYERSYNILVMMIGVLMYSFAVSSLGTIFTTYDNYTAKYLKNIQLLDEINDNFPKLDSIIGLTHSQESNNNYEEDEENTKYRYETSLFSMLKNFFRYDFKVNRTDKINLINDLPNIIKNELLYKMYKDMIKNFTFFRINSNRNNVDNFNSKIILSMRPVKLRKNEFLIKKGERVEEIFLVKKGVLSIEDEIKDDFHRIVSLRKNDYFGLISVLNNEYSEINVRVKTNFAELYLINKKDIIELSREFPIIFKEIFKNSLYDYKKIQQMKRNLEEKRRKNLKISKNINLDLPKNKCILPTHKKNITSNQKSFIEENYKMNNNSILSINSKKNDKNDYENESISYKLKNNNIRVKPSLKKDIRIIGIKSLFNIPKKSDINKSNKLNKFNQLKIEKSNKINLKTFDELEQKNKFLIKGYESTTSFNKKNDKLIDNNYLILNKSLSSDKFISDKSRVSIKDSSRISIITKTSKHFKSIGSNQDFNKTLNDEKKKSKLIRNKNENLKTLKNISNTIKMSLKLNQIVEKNPKQFIHNNLKFIIQKLIEIEKQEFFDLYTKLDHLYEKIYQLIY